MNTYPHNMKSFRNATNKLIQHKHITIKLESLKTNSNYYSIVVSCRKLLSIQDNANTTKNSRIFKNQYLSSLYSEKDSPQDHLPSFIKETQTTTMVSMTNNQIIEK